MHIKYYNLRFKYLIRQSQGSWLPQIMPRHIQDNFKAKTDFGNRRLDPAVRSISALLMWHPACGSLKLWVSVWCVQWVTRSHILTFSDDYLHPHVPTMWECTPASAARVQHMSFHHKGTTIQVSTKILYEYSAVIWWQFTAWLWQLSFSSDWQNRDWAETSGLTGGMPVCKRELEALPYWLLLKSMFTRSSAYLNLELVLCKSSIMDPGHMAQYLLGSFFSSLAHFHSLDTLPFLMSYFYF